MADAPPFPRMTLPEARAWQERQRRRVVATADPGFAPTTVAGVDTSIRDDLATAAIVVMRLDDFTVLETATATRAVEFPYVPGYLAIREMPAIVDAWHRLAQAPDLLLVDGHGRVHPRRFGIACTLGVHVDRPSIGCGKSPFVGEHREPGARRGCRAQVRDRVLDPAEWPDPHGTATEVIGTCLRTRDGVRPIYVSVGHRIDLASAARLVLRCCRRFRLPEPIRAADRLAGSVRGERPPPPAGP